MTPNRIDMTSTWIDRRRGVARVTLVALVAAAMALAGCADADGAADHDADRAGVDEASEPRPAPSTDTVAGSVTTLSDASVGASRPEGFDTVTVVVTTPDGERCELCLWLAADDERRRRGLMFVDDLGEADGMAFVYSTPRTTAFTMRNTLLPLTIVFYDADGHLLDSFDMEPCREEVCPTYPTPPDFSVAIEVEQGRADELGLIAGSRLEIIDVGGPLGCAL